MPLRIGTPLPELTGATEWVNGAVERESLIGSPVLLHFWAMSCHYCHDNMPTIQQWRQKYADKGLKVVAIHMPRQQEDTNIESVKADIASMGLKEPCAIDNEHIIGDRFENQLWPAYFLFDKDGNMKSRAGGHAGLSMIEGALKRLLETGDPA
jgi:thiol-disulfide isomerase/thioredoxin